MRSDLAGTFDGGGAGLVLCYDTVPANYLHLIDPAALATRFHMSIAYQALGAAGQAYSAFGFSSLSACDALQQTLLSSGGAEVNASLSSPSLLVTASYPTACHPHGEWAGFQTHVGLPTPPRAARALSRAAPAPAPPACGGASACRRGGAACALVAGRQVWSQRRAGRVRLVDDPAASAATSVGSV